jgi:predicted nucleic acid-binding protein
VSLVLIDTSIWIEVLRQSPATEIHGKVESLLMEKRAAWCGMIELELWSGVRDAKERKALSNLGSLVRSLDTNASVWRLACQYAAQGRSAGVTAPATDYLVFACSQFYKTELLHRDKHLERLTKLESK